MSVAAILRAQTSGLIRWPRTRVSPQWGVLLHFPNTVAAIDCTEIFIERSQRLATQKMTFSSYKSHTTIKYLAAVDLFTGSFVYMSDGFPGSTSDRAAVEKSGLLDQMLPGQRILADRGFKIADLLAEKCAFLSIPTLLKGRQQLREQEALHTRRLASARVHVERAFRRIREFKFIDHRQPNSQTFDNAITGAAALVNLQTRLICEKV